MHNEKEQEMTSPVSHGQGGQGAVRGEALIEGELHAQALGNARPEAPTLVGIGSRPWTPGHWPSGPQTPFCPLGGWGEARVGPAPTGKPAVLGVLGPRPLQHSCSLEMTVAQA